MSSQTVHGTPCFGFGTLQSFLWNHIFFSDRAFTIRVLAVFINSGYSFWWDVTNDWGFDLMKPGTWSSLTRKLASQSQPPEPETMLMDFRTPSPIAPQQPHDHAHALKTSNPLTSPSSATFRPAGRSPTASLSSSSTSSSIDGSGALSSSPFLPRTSAPKHPFGLRRRLLFRPHLVYYAVLLLNLVLRFTWSLKLSSHLHGVAELESGVFIIEGAELVRRWMWVFFRVEWEVIRLEDDSETTTTTNDTVRPPLLIRPAAALAESDGFVNWGIAELVQIEPGP